VDGEEEMTFESKSTIAGSVCSGSSTMVRGNGNASEWDTEPQMAEESSEATINKGAI